MAVSRGRARTANMLDAVFMREPEVVVDVAVDVVAIEHHGLNKG
jgi:hypothetical protein